MTMYQNINQFEQKSIKGAIDLLIGNNGIISGVVSASQATALVPGQKVKLDTTADVSVPSFIAAADADIPCFYVVYTTKDNFSTGSAIEVCYFGGPVIYLESAAAIAAGAVVESAGTGLTVQTFSAGKQCGICLDPVSASGMLTRIILTTPSVIHA